MIKAQTLKGFRDFLPKEAIRRQQVITKIRNVFERFGFDPLETPALEYAETLLGKYGEEADKLLYTFRDRGDRNVGMRYDQTVPLARVIAQYPDIPKPFKRYQIQTVWRAENTQKGRYREFLQCDADIVGVRSHAADAEILSLFSSCFAALDLDYVLYVNSREILFSLLHGLVQDTQRFTVLQSIDKLDKKPEEEVRAELEAKGFSARVVDDIFSAISRVTLESDDWLSKVVRIATEHFGIPKDKLVFKPTLVRGLDYYTGLIMEAGLSTGGSSIGGGGRYDRLIGQFNGTDTPAVGFALGFDRIMDILMGTDTKTTNTTVFVATAPDTADRDGQHPQALSLTGALRKAGVNAEVNLDMAAKLEKQLKYADKKGIPYVAIVGDTVVLKNMKTKEQRNVSAEELPKLFSED